MYGGVKKFENKVLMSFADLAEDESSKTKF